MSIRLGLVSGVARHGIFSALVGPRIMLAPDEGGGTGGGGDGGSGGGGEAPGGATGAGSGDTGGGTAANSAKPSTDGKEPKSALAGAIEAAAAKPEGEGGKSPAGNDKVEGADKVKPGDPTGEKKEGDGGKEKTADEIAAEAAAPKDIDGNPIGDRYEVKMPDGVEMDAGLMEIATPIFKEAKLSPAQAQAVTDLYVKTQEQAISKHVETVNGWLKESQKDKEIGGKDYEKNLGHAARAFQAFGNERGMQIIDTYGLGNNPDILRIFVRMGKALGEGSTVLPGAEHGSVSDAQVLYPSMTAKN